MIDLCAVGKGGITLAILLFCLVEKGLEEGDFFCGAQFWYWSFQWLTLA